MDRILPSKAIEEGDLQRKDLAKPKVCQGKQAWLSNCAVLRFGSAHENLRIFCVLYAYAEPPTLIIAIAIA